MGDVFQRRPWGQFRTHTQLSSSLLLIKRHSLKLHRPLKPTGFTLIELLVSIGVVGILMALLLPALSGSVGNARSLRCLVSLRSLGTAEAAWAVDHRDVYPNVLFDNPDSPFVNFGFGSISGSIWNSQQSTWWVNPLRGYAWEGSTGFLSVSGNFEAISCPQMTRSGAFLSSGFVTGDDLTLNPFLEPMLSYRGGTSMFTESALWLGSEETTRAESEINDRRKLVRFFEVAFPSQKAVKIERLAYHATSRRQEAGAGASFQLLAADGSASAVALPRLVTPLPVAFHGAVGTFNDGTDVTPRRSAIDGTPEGHRGLDFTPPAP